jgi:predicted aspartyl protease
MIAGLAAAGPLPTHILKLHPFMTPPAIASGVLVHARINGGPLLRLLLDSGAQDVVLDPRAARKSGCTGGTGTKLVTPGAPASTARRLVARTIEAGDLTFHDVAILVADRRLAEGIQGVLPLSLFSDFLIRIDFRGESMELLPYGAEPDAAGALPAIARNRLLFVRGRLNRDREGYFLLDTGASYTAVSHVVAREFSVAEKFFPRVALQMGTVPSDAALLRSDLRFQIGPSELRQTEAVVIDFSSASRYHGIEIAGLIGYPALCRSVLTVDYRDTLVRIDRR